MQRRRALRWVAGGCLAGLAGCLSNPPTATGPRNPPAPSEPRPDEGTTVDVGDFDIEESESGTLRVVGTVENRGETRATARVVAEATVDGETTTGTTTVPVPANGTAEFSVVVDVRYDRFQGSGSLSVRVA